MGDESGCWDEPDAKWLADLAAAELRLTSTAAVPQQLAPAATDADGRCSACRRGSGNADPDDDGDDGFGDGGYGGDYGDDVDQDGKVNEADEEYHDNLLDEHGHPMRPRCLRPSVEENDDQHDDAPLEHDVEEESMDSSEAGDQQSHEVASSTVPSSAAGLIEPVQTSQTDNKLPSEKIQLDQFNSGVAKVADRPQMSCFDTCLRHVPAVWFVLRQQTQRTASIADDFSRDGTDRAPHQGVSQAAVDVGGKADSQS